MSDDLTITGGSGPGQGITAKFDDMLSYAGVLDSAGDGLRTASGRLGGLLTSGDLAQALVLCPAEVAEAEAAIALAATGPKGALWTSEELEISGQLLRSSVDAYKWLDEQLANVGLPGPEELAYDVAGYAIGSAAPLLALLGGSVWALSQSNPELAQALKALEGAAGPDLQQTLFDHPWMEEALTRMAPGMVQGAGFSLSGLIGPGGLIALSSATGGNWPTTDYQSAIAGLIALAGLGGAFQDTGKFGVSKVPGSGRTLDINGKNIVSTIFNQQRQLGSDSGQVQVITVPGKPPSYIVQIPGTEDWTPTRGNNPADVTTDIRLESMQGRTVMQEEVAATMHAAGIKPGDPVMLTGHSQGGITAAAMASDPDLKGKYNITSVVTGGSPIGRFHIPSNVSVLSLEHDQDIVPKLDGADNPDRPNWITVKRHLSDAEGTQHGQRGLIAAHSTTNYRTTGADVDASTSKTIQKWRQKNAQFLTGDASAARYQISPVR